MLDDRQNLTTATQRQRKDQAAVVMLVVREDQEN